MLRANILLLGKSGAGKSSLLNYIWGDVIAKTGAGSPVTERSSGDATGIYPSKPLQVDNELELVIHDSWGMEADRADEWNALIREETEKREGSPKIEDWFHAVIYCVSAKGARIEDFEIQKVVQPLIDNGHAVIFVLTKCGVASETEKQKVYETIHFACPSHGGIIEVESVPVTLRGRASPTETKGRDILLEAVKRNFVTNLGTKLKRKYLAHCGVQLDEWQNGVLRFYDEKVGFFKPTAGTFNEISEMTVSSLHHCLSSLDRWREDRDVQAKRFHQLFGEVILQEPNFVGERFLFRYAFLNTADFVGSNGILSFVLKLFPMIDLALWQTRKSSHRDELAKELSGTVREVLDMAQNESARPKSLMFARN